MSVRGKMFIAMTVMIILISSTFIQLSLEFLANRFEKYSADKIASWFESYYENNENSWDGIDLANIPDGVDTIGQNHGGIALLSPDGRLLFHKGRIEADTVLKSKYKKKMITGGSLAGILYVDRWESSETLQLKSYLLRWMAIGSTVAAIFSGIVAFLIGYWLVRIFTRPLQRLIPAVEKVAGSDFQFQLPVTTKDEFGKLTKAFNQMTQRLLHAEEVRKRLVADVAHELRTPLTIIQSRLEYIQEGGQQVPPETLLPLQDEVMRLSKLVDDLHQLTLAEAGKLPLAKQHIDLTELLQRMIEILKPEADERQIGVSIESHAKRAVAHLDPHRMMQVFYNVLSNAIRYTMPGGSVAIRIAVDHRENGAAFAAISIADTGVGIPEEQLTFVFNRFHRVEEARSRHAGGMGLGLAIAKEFVEAHQGSITVKSEVDKGTEFTIFLPLCTED
ncbi:sensor histidine kinase [Cohnella silvisoli]|uniref:histidine kinase n=1 Tax=Cohnella silvisoli TaxID=2873699 RepID=A0ABV1KQS3_9BACL|nr:ATP-binding protein [Cohnella silvisoli]MCD9024636.1 HAMP domain-containing protein [Cohnella silvisoli]